MKTLKDKIGELDKIIEQDSEKVNDDSYLYHYTDIKGLIGILSDNNIRLTQRNFMNDIYDQEYSTNVIIQQFEKIYGKKKAAIEYDSFNICFQDNSEYIFSLSIEEDSIHQWNYYNNGGGYSLAFKRKDIADSLRSQFENFRSAPVIYDPCLQNKYSAYLIELMKTRRDCVDIDSNDHTLLHPDLYLSVLSSLFKQKHHACEREFRVSVVSNNKKIKFRDRGGMFVPYIEMAFQQEKIPIKTITIGPKVERGIALEGLNQYLESVGRSDIKTKTSELRIRF